MLWRVDGIKSASNLTVPRIKQDLSQRKTITATHPLPIFNADIEQLVTDFFWSTKICIFVIYCQTFVKYCNAQKCKHW